MSRKMKILFTVSLLLNVALLGAVVGLVSADLRPEETWKEAQQELSPEGHALVTQAFRGGLKNMLPLFKKAGEERRNLTRIMAAEQFDAAAFDRAAHDLHKIQDAITDKKIEIAKNLVETLSREDREKFAEHMVKSISWRGGGNRRDGKRGSYDHPRPPP